MSGFRPNLASNIGVLTCFNELKAAKESSLNSPEEMLSNETYEGFMFGVFDIGT